MNSHFRAAGSRTFFGALGALVCVVPLSASAQDAPPPDKPTTDRTPPPVLSAPQTVAAQKRELNETVALLPWSYRSGKDVAIQSAREVCNQLLLETGFNVFLTRSPTGAMPPAMPGSQASRQPESPFAHLLDQGRALLGQEVSNRANSPYVLPSTEEMTAIGEKLGTRYVLAGRAQWTSRNVWVGIANRVKATCTVDLQILDVSTGHLVLDSRNVVGDSTENKNMFGTLFSAVSLNPLPLVLPGSATPEQERAATVAIARAIEPWLKTQRIRFALMEADQSGEVGAAITGTQIPRFSTLLASLSDIQVSLHATTPDEQLATLDKDLARLETLHDLTLQYKEPNKVRLSATSPKNGLEELIINERERAFLIPEHRSIVRQDTSEAPNRRLSLLDFCGLLTPGMFDYMRARYVKQDKQDGVNTIVYDMSYWGIEDGSYHRIWIDPNTHVVLRNEIYDRGSKLKAICLYRQVHPAGAQIQLPGRIEIQNANRKILTSITLSDAKINQGISDDVFHIEAPQNGSSSQQKAVSRK
jgi:outer membrane lipoprotein-sorting protein